jgi:hypothetical protein
MHTAIVRLIADWLAHPTHGVAAQWNGVPLGDDPDITRAAVPQLGDESRREELARLQAPDALPAITVHAADQDSATVSLQPFPNDTEVEVVIRHIVRNPNTTEALWHLDQGQRAIGRAMKRALVNLSGTPRNACFVTGITRYRAELEQSNDDTIHAMAHRYGLRVRDTWTTA